MFYYLYIIYILQITRKFFHTEYKITVFEHVRYINDVDYAHWFFVQVISLLHCSCAFLLYDHTASSLEVTDGDYKALETILRQERQSFAQILQRLSNAENETQTLKSELNDRSFQLSLLSSKHDQLKQNYTAVAEKANRLEIEMRVFQNFNVEKQLSNVNKNIEDLYNNLLKTNNVMKTLLFESEARNQDLIALNRNSNKFEQNMSASAMQVAERFKALELNFTSSSVLRANEIKLIKAELEDNARNVSKLTRDIAEVDNQLIKTSKALNSLLFENLARKEDLIALNQNLEVQREMEQKMYAELARYNSSLLGFQQDLQQTLEKVAFTSCGSGNPVFNTGSSVELPHIMFETGINLQSFVSTGKFTCEQRGLYIVYINIMSSSSDAFVHVYKNAQLLTSAYTTLVSNGYIFSGSAMAAVDLANGDQISIIAQRNNININPSSCMTVIKVK